MFQISDFARCHCNWSGYKPSTSLSLWQIYVIPLLIFQYPLNILLCMVYFIDLCISSSQSITQKISLTVFFTVWSLQVRTCSTKEQWEGGLLIEHIFLTRVVAPFCIGWGCKGVFLAQMLHWWSGGGVGSSFLTRCGLGYNFLILSLKLHP